MKVLDYWLRPYRLLKEPRVVSAALAVGYLALAFLVGIPTVLAPPDTFMLDAAGEAALGWIVGIMTVLGGTFASASLHGGAWFMERSGILFLIGGLAARLVFVIVSPDGVFPTLIQSGEIIALILILAARGRWVSELMLDPTKPRRSSAASV